MRDCEEDKAIHYLLHSGLGKPHFHTLLGHSIKEQGGEENARWLRKLTRCNQQRRQLRAQMLAQVLVLQTALGNGGDAGVVMEELDRIEATIRSMG